MIDIFEQLEVAEERKRLYGVYPALVTDIKDADGQGRVKVKLLWTPDNSGSGYDVWARLAVLMAGKNRGSWFIPDVNDEVLIAFAGGDPRQPIVIGALWNGQDTPPESMDGAGNNYKKTLRSRNGVKITLDDTDGQETLTLETPGGQKLILKDGPGSVELKDSNGNSLKMDQSGIKMIASNKFGIESSTMDVNTGMITANSATSKFSGLVQSDTHITNSTISTTYMPGVGNLL